MNHYFFKVRKRMHMALILLMLLAIGAAISAQAAIPGSERTVLINLYNSTAGASWTTSTNWNGMVGSECTWYGVTCDVGGAHIIQITLDGNNLVGTLPSLNGLIALQRFDAGTNQLIGSIPDLSGLTNLQIFTAFSNQLTGSVPALAGLIKLEYFGVSGNQLTGSIPTLAGLTALQFINVGSNQLTGSIPNLTGLTNLQQVGVYNNQLTGPIPNLIGLTNLQQFNAQNNQLSGPIPTLTGLTNLLDLQVANNLLTGTVPDPPNPNNLIPAASTLCPNQLSLSPTLTTNTAWDGATGVTPWNQLCESLNNASVSLPTIRPIGLVLLSILFVLIGGWRSTHTHHQDPLQ